MRAAICWRTVGTGVGNVLVSCEREEVAQTRRKRVFSFSPASIPDVVLRNILILPLKRYFLFNSCTRRLPDYECVFAFISCAVDSCDRFVKCTKGVLQKDFNRK